MLFFCGICLFLVFQGGFASAEVNNQNTLEFFDSFDAVNYAMQNSKEVSFQRIQSLQNIQLKKYSIRSFFPSVSLSYSENDSINIMAPDSRSKSFQISLSQQVYNGGKTKLEYDMNLMTSQYEYQEFILSARRLQSEVINKYFELLMQKKTLEIQSSLCEAAGTQLLILKREYELGLSLETDFLEYQISYKQLEYDLKKYEREYKKLEEEFKRVLGISKDVFLIISDDFISREDYVLLNDRSADIVNTVKMMSVTLRKSELALNYNRRLQQFENRQNLPSVSLQSSMAFSGVSLPLTEPSFSVRCTISFQNPFFPVSMTGGINADQQRISGSSRSIETQLLQSSTYPIEKKLGKISLLMGQLQYDASVSELETTVKDTIDTHDDTIGDMYMKKEMISLMERKLTIDKQKLDTGELKQIDYLKEMISLYKERISLMLLQLQIESSERSLEILEQLLFGGIVPHE